MIAVLDSAAMREADRITIEEHGLPSLVLMEMAANGVTEAIGERFGSANSVVVVCGGGNNGGDGLAVARQLHCRGFATEVVLLVAPEALVGDAKTQLDLAGRFAVPIHICADDDMSLLHQTLSRAEVVVDGLFGTGLDRPLAGRWVEVIQAINQVNVPVVAIDIPSGLSGSTAAVIGECVDAVVTVTFATPKLPHALPPACWHCGEVAVADIGIPPWTIEKLANMALLEAEDVASWLPRRGADAHKGQFGHLLIIAGRVGRAGAAALAARAAVVAGAGLVTVATPEGAVFPIQSLVPEAMVDSLPQGEDGAARGDGLEGCLLKATAVAIGPGIGLGEGSARLIDTVLEKWQGPLILDADALTLLAGKLERLRERSAATVLTPHPGELARLLGVSTAEVTKDRLTAARKAAQESQAVVLAKGARTIIIGGEGVDVINPTGCPGLASGGAGDVLTGVLGAFLAQGLSGKQAAAAAAWLHGRAAELASDDFPGAIPASEVAKRLPSAEAELRELL